MPQPPGRARQRGLTLVELMVSLVIGLLTALAILSMMLATATRQRLGGSVNEAQNSALIALATVEHDVLQAGYGLAHGKLQGCASVFSGLDGMSAPDFSLAAVDIVDGGGAPDTLRVRFAESVRADAPLRLVQAASADDASLAVDTVYGVRPNDVVVLADSAGRCTFRRATAVDGSVAPARLAVDLAGSQPAWPTYAPDDTHVFALGALTQRTYSVDAARRTLDVRELGQAAGLAIAQDIVDLQAQYGVSATASADEPVNEWVDARDPPWALPDAAARARIKAVRLAVVARAAEADSRDVSGAEIVLWPQVPAAAGQQSEKTAFTLAGTDRRHRYRVLRVVAPLRNLLWSAR